MKKKWMFISCALLAGLFLPSGARESRGHMFLAENHGPSTTSQGSVPRTAENRTMDQPFRTIAAPAAWRLEEIRQIEFERISYREGNPDYFSYMEGTLPILISAPHGALHYRSRENRWKGEDEYTASLAIMLGRLTGVHVIYVKNKTTEDPNNDLTSAYKTAVREAVKKYGIKFLMDLHGSDEGRPFKVDIGTLHDDLARSSCPTLRTTIQECFSDFGPRLFNQKFTANDPCTITSFARNELGIEAAQIEINARYRIIERKPDSTKAIRGIAPHFKAKPNDVMELITRMERMINEIARKIADGSACPSE